MRKLKFLVVAFCLVCFNKLCAQTYSGFGLAGNGTIYDTITIEQDTLTFNFSGLPSGVTQNARFVLYYEGDFGDQGEIAELYLPGFSLIGTAGPYPSGNDCDVEDSTSINVNTTTLNALTPTFSVYVITSQAVNAFCTTQRIRVRLEYDYCIFGAPTYADFTPSSTVFCPTDASITLTGTPANGTFSGPGVTGNNFNPSALSPGEYSIVYTATDAIGCITTKTQNVKVKSKLADVDILTCEGTTPSVNLGQVTSVLSYDLARQNIIDTTTGVSIFPAITVSPTVIYRSTLSSAHYYTLDTVTATNFAIVDHDNITSDDRSGIAITDSTVYIVGDNNTGRYDLDLTNPVSLPVMDGIFTDLAQRKIYSLFNTTQNTVPDGNNGFNINALVSLNADLSIGSDTIILSEEIPAGFTDYAMILAGYNQLVIGDGFGNNPFYLIDIQSGDVTNLGQHNLQPYTSENWAIWGMSGYDGSDFHAYYRNDNNGEIMDYNFSTQVEASVSSFNDYSDMACFIVHPVNHRMYFHYEGGTSTFGGSSETLGYTDASDSTSVLSGNNSLGCPNPYTFTFNTVDLGPDTTVCSQNGVFVLEAGFGYNSYTWNGVNNNYNVYFVQDSGQVTVSVIDDANCVISDSIVVNVVSCLGVDELAFENTISVYPNPSTGEFKVDYLELGNEGVITILDMNGKIVHTTVLSSGSTSVSINVDLMKGVYILNIESENGSARKSLVIQ